MSFTIEIYRTEDGKSEIEVTLEGDTIWLSINQISELFERDKSVVSRHIGNIFREKELILGPTVAKNATVPQNEGGRVVSRKIDLYSLDVIISVGYRVKSKRATQFRIWATNLIKNYLLQGYAINEKRLHKKEKETIFLRSGIKILSRAIEEKASDEGFHYLKFFARGLELLDDFDHESLDKKGLTSKRAIYPIEEDYRLLVNIMRIDFQSNIFGLEKDESFKSAIAQISKGFGEKDFYPTIEEKAATLLYLIVKNHAFIRKQKNCCGLLSNVPPKKRYFDGP